MDLILYRQILEKLPITVTLRHDVDISLEAAMKMAELEREMGVRANYYLMQSSPFYTLKHHYVSALRGMGHNVGLHLYYWEVGLNEVFSMHNPYGITFHLNDENTARRTHVQYGGVTNHNIVNHYVSDSRGIMPEIPTKGVLNIHPEWWVYPGATPQDKLKYYFNQQYEKCLKEILPD